MNPSWGVNAYSTTFEEKLETTFDTKLNDFTALQHANRNYEQLIDYFLISRYLKVIQPQRVINDLLEQPLLLSHYKYGLFKDRTCKIYNPSDHFPIHLIVGKCSIVN